MLAAVSGEGDVITGGRPHAGHLVGGHRRADARAVNHNAAVALAGRHQPRHGVGDARVVRGVLAVRSAILGFVAAVAQPGQEPGFQFKPAVIRANSYFPVHRTGCGDGAPFLAAARRAENALFGSPTRATLTGGKGVSRARPATAAGEPPGRSRRGVRTRRPGRGFRRFPRVHRQTPPQGKLTFTSKNPTLAFVLVFVQ